MPISIEKYRGLASIAASEFKDIVVDIEISDRLRICFTDGSFLDVWFSQSIPGKYAYHWERRHLNGRVFRWDNAAHKRWRNLRTFPVPPPFW